MQKKLLLTTCLIFSLNFLARADQGLLNEYLPYIDTALQAVNMNKSDFAMPWDISSDDPYRLELIKALFDEPLNTFDAVNEEAHFIQNHYDNPAALFSHIAANMDAPYDHISLPEATDPGISSWNRFRLNRQFPDHADAIVKYVESATVAQELLDSAFARLSDKELEKLKSQLPAFYTSVRENTGNQRSIHDLKSRREAQRDRRRKARKLFSIAESFRPAYLYKASEIMYDASLSIVKKIKEKPLPDNAFTFSTNAGKIALGEVPDEAPLLLITDGSDTKINWKQDKQGPAIQTIIAPGGNNVYRGNHSALGSGFFGIGILIDMEGNDTYLSQSYAQGSGFFGTGILLDMGGDDYYSSSVASQGSGAFGAGLLFDIGGNDILKGGQYVQGAGWVAGYGAVYSGGGGDRFITSSEFIDALRYEDRHLSLSQGMGMGYRPYASGGIGMLVNASGNNLYQTDIFGQGSAYWFALGGLVDFGGHDQYLSHQYAQGAGVHMAFGALLDLGGNDLFKTHGVSQGCGHDYAFGGFYSAGGDDDVVCGGLSQGTGNANGSGLFINGGGDNAYIARQENTQGYADFRRGFGTTGLFLNFSDNAWYGAYHGKPGSRWVSGTYGSGMDIQPPKKDEVRQQQQNDTARIIRHIASDPEELFLQASEPLIQLRFLVEPARDSLANLGEEGVAHIMHYLDSDIPREIHAMRTLIRMFEEKPTPYLRDSLTSQNRQVASNALNLLIEMAKDSLGSGAMDEVLKKRDSENWRTRVSAYRYLGYFNNPELTEYIKPGLQDSKMHVRRAASEAMRRGGDMENAPIMADLLNDASQMVRYNAEKFFARHESEGREYLMNKVIFEEDLPAIVRLHALGALTRMEKIDRESALRLTELSDKDWRYRKRLAETIPLIDDKAVAEKMKEVLEDDKNPYVQRILESI